MCISMVIDDQTCGQGSSHPKGHDAPFPRRGIAGGSGTERVEPRPSESERAKPKRIGDLNIDRHRTSVEQKKNVSFRITSESATLTATMLEALERGGAVWIFAYGSLMADGWEQKHQCISRGRAVISGYSRAFDKASIESRGTREHPAPTLRIVPSSGACEGVAFEFAETAREAVLRELRAREGPSFPLRVKKIDLADGRSVDALVPIYEGHRLLTGLTLRQIAEMAIAARGGRGNGVDYVRDVSNHLTAAGINDPVVTSLLHEIEAATKPSP